MPTYSYSCSTGHEVVLVMTIAEMEAFERSTPMPCPGCPGSLTRLLARPRNIAFHEGFYEHVSEAGAYISNMSDLRRIAKENGNYSQYAEELGGLFKAKEGRWI